MGFWETGVPANVQSWLLKNPDASVRYLTLRDLVDHSPSDPDVLNARTEAHASGKIPEILSHMHPEGYWDEPGAGYLKKYFSSVWSLITLAQLGANVKADQRIEQACAYYLSQAMTENGQITANGTPSTTADCLQGNMCAAFLDLGFEDERIDKCFEWLARSVTGEGVAPIGTKGASLRYYAGKVGPDFRCGSNNKLPCAWGAVKVMLAFTAPQRKALPADGTSNRTWSRFLLCRRSGICPISMWIRGSAQPRLVEIWISCLLYNRPFTTCRSIGQSWFWK